MTKADAIQVAPKTQNQAATGGLKMTTKVKSGAGHEKNHNQTMR